ncbi:MAG: putative transcriptional regulator [Bacteriovoracaceae bacterium]|jgi:DNA-binding transcriptional regulator YiaG
MASAKNKKITITDDNFAEILLGSMSEAVEHAQGKVTLKSETLELPSEPPVYTKSKIKRIREEILKVSQPVFASILACSPSAIKAWERGDNKPNGVARRLLQIIESDPSKFIKNISTSK